MTAVNQFGTTLWNRTIGTPGLDGVFGTPVASSTSDGGAFVVAGRSSVATNNDDDVWLIRLSPSGSIYWERTYHLGIDAARSVVTTAGDGCAILAETRFAGTNDLDLWLLQVDRLGEPQWERRISTPASDRAVDIEATPNGGYAIVGETTGIDNSLVTSTWVAQLDAQGQVGSHCHSIRTVTSTSESPRTGLQFEDLPHSPDLGTDFRERSPVVVPMAVAQLAQCATNADPWTDLGNGTGGLDGVPTLAGVGRLRPGEYFAFVAGKVRPGASGALIVGPSAVNVPILGVTLVPLPQFVFSNPVVPVHGGPVKSFRWPLGLPVGHEIFAQYVAIDSLGPQGLSASNAVVGRAP